MKRKNNIINHLLAIAIGINMGLAGCTTDNETLNPDSEGMVEARVGVAVEAAWPATRANTYPHGAHAVGAPLVGALDVGALDVGALDVGALDVGALDVGAHHAASVPTTRTPYDAGHTGHPQEVPLHAASPVGAPLVGALDMDAATRTPSKPSFLPGDHITLSHHHGVMPVETRMTLDTHGTTWLTTEGQSPDITINTTGNTKITARATHGTDQINTADEGFTTYADLLQAEADLGKGITANAGQYHVDLNFHHARTLIHIYKVVHADGKTECWLDGAYPVTLHIEEAGGTPRKLQAEPEWNKDDRRYETYFIIPPDATITAIEFWVYDAAEGQVDTYTAYPSGTYTFEGGTIYTPELIIGAPDVPATFSIGNTGIDPWLPEDKHGNYTHAIASAQDLLAFATEVNNMTADQRRAVRAIQTADIDLAGHSWTPIGNASTRPFTGLYNGNGYTISNLEYHPTTGIYHGLFGYLDPGARIVNVHLREVDINSSGSASSTRNTYTGALAGQAYGAYIALCTATGQVTGETYTGGLIGYAAGIPGSDEATYTHITRSSAQCQVTAAGSADAYAGGLVGATGGNCRIIACMAGGDVENTGTSSGSCTGGLVGDNYGTIIYCYAIGTATGTVTGGLAGYHDTAYSGIIANSYTTADELTYFDPIATFTNCWDKTYGDANPTQTVYNIVSAANSQYTYTWTGTEFARRRFNSASVWIAPTATGAHPKINYSYNGTN